MKKLHKKNHHKILSVVEPNLPVYYRPKITVESEIITVEQVSTIALSFLKLNLLTFCVV